MKRILLIAIAGFVLGCLLARHALGADGEWVYWWPPTSNAIGGYRVTARPLNPPTNAPPALPVSWLLRTNELIVRDMESRLFLGTNEVTAISIGGETLVTNGFKVDIQSNGVSILRLPNVITNFIANSPPSAPRYHTVVAPMVTKYVPIQTGTSITSLRTVGGVTIYSGNPISNLFINLKP